MKKILFSSLLVFLSMSLFISCDDDDDDQVIPASELPVQAQAFVKEHFPNATYNRVERDDHPDDNGGIYDVYLSNGFDLEFDTKGLWVEVNGYSKQVPETIIALLPEGVPTYVKTTYPTLHIASIEKKLYGFEIELNNDLDLMFNFEGAFLGIDK